MIWSEENFVLARDIECKNYSFEKFILKKYKNKKGTPLIKSREKSIVVCDMGHCFSTSPYNLICRKNKCPICSRKSNEEKTRMSVSEFVKRSKEIHGDKYDYSLVEKFKNSREKVTLTCKKHKIKFESQIRNHIHRKAGCYYCGNESRAKKNKENNVVKNKKPLRIRITTKENFIKRAKEIHGEKYDYSKVEYHGCKKVVSLKCLNHDVNFYVYPYYHLVRKTGCTECRKEKKNNKTNRE